ncbi:MAG: hypothetical protein JXB85_18050 [Anaerolineales bacterium]|nr:hypothetical protein [Anaerolineales bacterium]
MNQPAPASPAAGDDPFARQPSLILGFIGGGLGMVLGATAWGFISYFTDYQISWMAIGVGFLVGLGVRLLGRGNSVLFGLVAAALSLGGCLLGNFIFYGSVLAREYGLHFFEVISIIAADPGIIVELFRFAFNPMDLFFYAIAIFVGFQTACSAPKRTAPQR